jgi:hypothetical protein
MLLLYINYKSLFILIETSKAFKRKLKLIFNLKL